MANNSKEDIVAEEPKKDNRIKIIMGILSIIMGLFIFISLASYLSTWREDQDIVQHYGVKIFSVKDVEIENVFGVSGAYISHALGYSGFGIASFFISFFFFALGANLMTSRRVFKLWPIFKYIVAGLLIISVSLAFFTRGAEFSWGGATGELIKDWLVKWIGDLGTMIVIVAVLLIYVIWQFNPSFSFLSRRKPATVKTKSEEKEAVNDKDEAKLFIDETVNKTKPGEKKGVSVIMPEDKTDDGEEFTLEEDDEDDEESTETITEELPEFVLTEEDDEPEEAQPQSVTVIQPATKKTDAATKKSDNTEKEVLSEIIIGAEEKTVKVQSKGDYEPTLDLGNYKYPDVDMLELHGTEKVVMDKDELEENKNQIINTLKNYDIQIQRISATVGPTVTLYEIVPAPGVRISRIKNLEDDIALSLAALGIRIIAPIPGKGTVGIEVPNVNKNTVSMRALISSEKFQNNNFSLPIAIGKKINNENFIVDLASMPHLLMAGATGQGKSVGINALLVSLLYKKHPSQLKFVLVDPKKVELSIYRLIEKHFLAKLPGEDEEAIITDTKKVITSLNALCIEMDNRYDLLKEASCRNIKEYNEKFVKRRLNPEKGHQFLPFIVLVIDEFADLIMTAGKEIEMPIARLAQLARAVGIHLIIATQRPSVNIITGIIKANFPARIAFKVSSKIDSRTILDVGGAEQLIGKGDMLISYNGAITRLQCAFVDTPEVDKIVHFIGEQQGYPEPYMLPEYVDEKELGGTSADLSDRDSLFDEAAKLIVANQVGSTSLIQRKMKLGYNRAGRIMDQLEMAGIVGKSQGSKPRDVLIQTEAHLMEILEGL